MPQTQHIASEGTALLLSLVAERYLTAGDSVVHRAVIEKRVVNTRIRRDAPHV